MRLVVTDDGGVELSFSAHSIDIKPHSRGILQRGRECLPGGQPSVDDVVGGGAGDGDQPLVAVMGDRDTDPRQSRTVVALASGSKRHSGGGAAEVVDPLPRELVSHHLRSGVEVLEIVKSIPGDPVDEPFKGRAAGRVADDAACVVR